MVKALWRAKCFYGKGKISSFVFIDGRLYGSVMCSSASMSSILLFLRLPASVWSGSSLRILLSTDFLLTADWLETRLLRLLSLFCLFI